MTKTIYTVMGMFMLCIHTYAHSVAGTDTAQAQKLFGNTTQRYYHQTIAAIN